MGLILTRAQLRKIILNEYKRMMTEISKKKKVDITTSDEPLLDDAMGLRLVKRSKIPEEQLDYTIVDIDEENNVYTLVDPVGIKIKVNFKDLEKRFVREQPVKDKK